MKAAISAFEACLHNVQSWRFARRMRSGLINCAMVMIFPAVVLGADALPTEIDGATVLVGILLVLLIVFLALFVVAAAVINRNSGGWR